MIFSDVLTNFCMDFLSEAILEILWTLRKDYFFKAALLLRYMFILVLFHFIYKVELFTFSS